MTGIAKKKVSNVYCNMFFRVSGLKMARIRRWTKRKIQTFQFKGRPARGLMWKKSVYREWFEYVKLYRSIHKKNPAPFRTFGNVSKFEFEEWWRDERYGFELFCEPEADDLVKVVDGRSSAEPNTVTLQVALNADPELTLRDFKRLMRELGSSTEYVSRARFQPSAPPKALKPDKLKQAREAFVISENTRTQTEAIIQLSKIPLPPKADGTRRLNPYLMLQHQQPTYKENGKLDLTQGEFANWRLSKLRVLSNHRKTVSDILKRLEAGVFP